MCGLQWVKRVSRQRHHIMPGFGGLTCEEKGGTGLRNTGASLPSTGVRGEAESAGEDGDTDISNIGMAFTSES